MSPLRLALILALLTLAGCSSVPQRSSGGHAVSSHGGYYLDDGPGDHPPSAADLAAIPDAVPKDEPVKASTLKPYRAMGKDYVPLQTVKGYKERGLASWYGRRYNGKPTASGEPYDMYAMTAAHPLLPIPCYVRVTNLENGRSVVVRVNDRGPFHEGRIIDLSYTAAWKLGVLKGVTPVEVDGIDPDAPAPGPASTTQTTTPPPAAPQQAASTAIMATPLPPLASANPEPAPAPNTPQPILPGTYLQFGAFATRTGADQLVQQLETRYGNSLPSVVIQQVGAMFKVRMGPFASVTRAEQAAQRVASETGIQSFKTSR